MQVRQDIVAPIPDLDLLGKCQEGCVWQLHRLHEGRPAYHQAQWLANGCSDFAAHHISDVGIIDMDEDGEVDYQITLLGQWIGALPDDES